MKKIALIPCLLLALLLGACSDNDQTDSSIELACPRLTYKVTDNLVTVTWTAIEKAEGYACKLNEDPYENIGPEATSFTGKLRQGANLFSIYAIGNKAHTTDSAVRTLEIEFDCTLPKPEVAVATESGVTTFTWKAVARAEGYAYKLDDETDFTKVKADVLTLEKSGLAGGQHVFYIYALGNGEDSMDSPVQELKFDIVDTSHGLFVRKTTGAITAMTETSSKVYTATIDCTAQDSFFILIDDVQHGFTAFSGNGGVGQVNSLFAAVPFYNGVDYYVRESMGQLTDQPAGELNALYVNMDRECRVEVTVDRNYTDGVPRYRMRLVESDDSIILAQYFDLMIYGGDWPNYKGGTGFKETVGEGVDGTAPGRKNEGTGTAFGAELVSTSDAGVETYLANRNLTGWTAEYAYEFPGCLRLCNSTPKTAVGILATPKLTALTGPTKVTATFDGMRFASEGDIKVSVLNAGTIASARVNVDGKTMTDITVEADGKSFIITMAHGTKFANAAIKSWSEFSFEIEGATAETQIRWESAVGSAGRYMLDNIVVRK